MALDIVSTIFGISPQQAEMQRREKDLSLGGLFAAATMNPYASPSVQNAYLKQQEAQFALGSLGARKLGGLFGLQDPEIQKAATFEKILQDTQTELGEEVQNPIALYGTLANKLNEAGFAKEAAMISMQGQKAMQDFKESQIKQQADLLKAQPDIVRLIAAKNQALAAGNMAAADTIQAEIDKKTYIPEKVRSPDTLAEETIRLDFISKYGEVEGARKFAEWQDARKEKVSAVQGTGKLLNVEGNPIGTYDEKGNFTSSSGRVISKENMNEFGQAQEASTNLLSIFDNITNQDIDKAFGFPDVTQNPAARLVANQDLVAAQYKINQAGVRDVLNNLQSLKGASTDMEMRKMASTFPGFTSNPEVMKKWLARAKATTTDFLNRQKNSYGFDAPTVNILEFSQDPLFNSLDEQEKANLIERLARWDVNFRSLEEKDKIDILNEIVSGSRVKSSQKQVVRSGTVSSGPNKGKKVIEYSDGSREYK